MSNANRTRRRELMRMMPKRLCTAHRSNGDPCRAAPILGGTVCWHHGGAAPAVRAKANQRLREGVLPLLTALYQLATSEKIPPAVRLAAIKDWLDRAGLSAKTMVEVEVQPWEVLLSGIVSSVDPETTKNVRQFFVPGEPDRSSPTVLTPGVDYAVSDEDYSPSGGSSSPAESVDYGEAPRHDPNYPPEPRAGQSSDRPRHGTTRRR